MDDCPHGMGKRASCIECMEDGPVTDPPKWEKVGGPFTANYNQECRALACMEFSRSIIERMHTIQRWDKGDKTVYTHVRCHP